ncbi:MAG: DUF2069 domain-containing protein [Gammaproteobacteria bacterium]
MRSLPPHVLQALVLLCWAVLFFGQMAWWGWLAEAPLLPRAALIFIAAGPLLLPLRGLLHDRPRSYFWFNLLALLYFAGGIAGAYASGGTNFVAWSQILASVGGFAAGFYRTKVL